MLWTSDQPDPETSTWRHTTLTRVRHPCTRQDSNPQTHKRASADPRLRPTGHWDRLALKEVNFFLGSHKDVKFSQIILSREIANLYSWVRNVNSPPLKEFAIYCFHAVTLTYLHIQVNYSPSSVDLPVHFVALNFMLNAFVLLLWDAKIRCLNLQLDHTIISCTLYCTSNHDWVALSTKQRGNKNRLFPKCRHLYVH